MSSFLHKLSRHYNIRLSFVWLRLFIVCLSKITVGGGGDKKEVECFIRVGRNMNLLLLKQTKKSRRLLTTSSCEMSWNCAWRASEIKLALASIQQYLPCAACVIEIGASEHNCNWSDSVISPSFFNQFQSLSQSIEYLSNRRGCCQTV